MSKKTQEQPQDNANDDIRLYEVGYLIVPITAEEDVAERSQDIRATIEAHEGTYSAGGDAEYIELAYSMEHHTGNTRNTFKNGYFGWITFSATGEQVEQIKKALDGKDYLIRFMIIRVPEHAALAAQERVSASKNEATADSQEEKKDNDVSDAEIDKAIKEIAA